MADKLFIPHDGPHPNPVGDRPCPPDRAAAPTPEGEGLFARSATRLSAFSALLLGWRPGEFWGATPAELGAIFSEMARGQDGDAPPAADDMAKLMEMFPDG